MKAVFDALNSWRILEHHASTQEEALEELLSMIRDIPELPPIAEMVKLLKDHEKVGKTTLAAGIWCPHTRVDFSDDLICVVGWSPQGILLNDGTRAHLSVLYLIPERDIGHFFKEISLFSSLLEKGKFPTFPAGQTMSMFRDTLMEWVSENITMVESESTIAKVIKIEPRLGIREFEVSNQRIYSFTLVCEGERNIILTQDEETLKTLQKIPNLSKHLSKKSEYRTSENSFIVRRHGTYAGGITRIDGLMISFHKSGKEEL